MSLLPLPTTLCIQRCSLEEWSQDTRGFDRHRSQPSPWLLVVSDPSHPTTVFGVMLPSNGAGVLMITSTPNCRGGHGPVLPLVGCFPPVAMIFPEPGYLILGLCLFHRSMYQDTLGVNPSPTGVGPYGHGSWSCPRVISFCSRSGLCLTPSFGCSIVLALRFFMWP